MNFKEKILDLFKSKKQKLLTFDQISASLGLNKGFDKKALASALNELIREDKLILTKRNKYTTCNFTSGINAKIIGSKQGYAFARPIDSNGEDIFIAERVLNGATHGDTVVVRLFKEANKNGKGNRESRRGKKQGEVVSIVERGFKTIVGLFQTTGGGAIVIPDDERFSDSLFIQASKTNGAKQNEKVVVKITEYPSRTRMAQGEVIEVLGDCNSYKVSTLSVIRSFGLIEEFPKSVLDEANKVNVPVSELQIEGRKDFRKELTITIDGEDARDFDDAISLYKKDEKYVLSVHIADVSHYVKENSELDKEAFKRGTSVYFPDYVLPMLPKVLSNGICSLNPDEDRLSMSVVIEFSKAGQITNYNIYEGVIRSNYRMTYTNVTKIFDGDKALREQYKEVVPMLEDMAELAKLLLKRRNDAGQLDFDLHETQINVDEEGAITEIVRKPRNLSDRLIEQFMVVTNEVIAKFSQDKKLPFVYRVHEYPSPDRVKAFKTFISNFGLRFGGFANEGYEPMDFQNILNDVKNEPYSAIVSNVMLRSMQKARYAPENLGHFGLALDNYCHFTSPIRRYPDLVIHRILKLYLKGMLNANNMRALENFVEEASEQSSLTERNADEAERAVDDLKKAEYMVDKIGQEFEGNISGITEGGIFVELDNTIEGYIYREYLPKDRYIFDAQRFTLIGKQNKFMLGDRLKVKVTSVDVSARHIDFELAKENLQEE